MMKFPETFDVVVLGFGLGGGIAALNAAQARRQNTASGKIHGARRTVDLLLWRSAQRTRSRTGFRLSADHQRRTHAG